MNPDRNERIVKFKSMVFGSLVSQIVHKRKYK